MKSRGSRRCIYGCIGAIFTNLKKKKAWDTKDLVQPLSMPLDGSVDTFIYLFFFTKEWSGGGFISRHLDHSVNMKDKRGKMVCFMCLVDLQKVHQKNQEIKALVDQNRNLWSLTPVWNWGNKPLLPYLLGHVGTVLRPPQTAAAKYVRCLLKKWGCVHGKKMQQ